MTPSATRSVSFGPFAHADGLQRWDSDTGSRWWVPKHRFHLHHYRESAQQSGDDEKPDLPAWQRGEWETAKRIASTDRFQKLPTKYEVHEWAIMLDFSRSVESDRIREDLLHAIHDAGAFRNFKDAVRRHGVESAWYAFRAEALKQIALNWCEKNHIVWE